MAVGDMLDVCEALMAEQMGLKGVALFVEAVNAPEVSEGESTDDDADWEEWGTDPDAQARMAAAMAMMGGSE